MLLLVCLKTSSSFAHLAHNINLQNLEFDISRNGDHVGYHHINFKWSKNGNLVVTNNIKFSLKKFGINFYKYQSLGIEKYDSFGQLVAFDSETDDNGKLKFCKIRLNSSRYKIYGTNYEGFIKEPFRISSYWNHDILKVSKQVSGITCRVIEQKVKFIKREKFKIMNQVFNTTVYNIRGPKLNTLVWFDDDTKMIVHQVLHKKGKWNYKLKNYQLIR